MSDNWIKLVPTDPWLVPTEESQGLARQAFWRIAPHADGIELIVSDSVQLRDCGANLNRIHCPTCRQDVGLDWWHRCMQQDYDGSGFRLEDYTLPGCTCSHPLNELVYDWPQGFSKFSLEAMNPNIGRLPDVAKSELERILMTQLIVIYQHI